MACANSVALQRAVAGDRDALATLLVEHGPAVARSLARTIPTRWQAVLGMDDVMQQTYIDAVMTIRQCVFCGCGAFHRWLATLARCNLRDAIKALEADKRGGARCRRPYGESWGSGGGGSPRLCDADADPSSRAERDEEVAALRSAIGALPPRYRRVVQSYDLHGDPVQSLAAELGRRPGAVFMIRARALRQLRERLLEPAESARHA